MSRRLVKAFMMLVVFALIASGCSKSSKSTPAASTNSPSPSATEGAAAVPTATTITYPVSYGFYDGHVDTMISTDVSNKAQASAVHINYSAAILTQPAAKYPSLYRVSGRAAPGQPQVFGTEPGESDYSPFWQEITVKWKAGVTPALLTKDDQIKSLAGEGKLTMTPTPIVLNCPIVKVSASSTIPTAKTMTLPVTYGYYDGHVDTMLSTEVSSKTQATGLGINYSAEMVTQPAANYPSLYQVSGPAAPGQPQVFGSEPGETDYSPLWQEMTVTWKTGVTPVLLVKDDQIKSLAGQGMLTVTATPIILNCPIIKTG